MRRPRINREGWDPVRVPRWAAPLFALAAVVLVPWVVLLVRFLPSDERAANWDVAWGGFDSVLALALLAAAITAWRRSPWLPAAAAAAAALLVVDAWFDILTSPTTADRVTAVAEAALVELPLAVLCLLAARPSRRAAPQPQAGSGSSTTQPRVRKSQKASPAKVP